MPNRKSSRQRKNHDMDLRLKYALGILVLFLMLFSSAVYGLWRLAENANHTQITVIAILFFFLIPIAFFLGHWFGRTEVRGFLSGIDTAVDRIAKTIDLRDTAKVTQHQRIQSPPQPRNYIPTLDVPTQGVPKLTFRESAQDQIIDL